MSDITEQTGVKPLERWTIVVGFLLSGIVIGVVAVSYVLNSPFPIKILVWIIGVAQAAISFKPEARAKTVRCPYFACASGLHVDHSFGHSQPLRATSPTDQSHPGQPEGGPDQHA